MEGYFPNGFKINNSDIYGSVLLLPRAHYLWNVENNEKISLESLQLFEIITPKVDLIMIGTGKDMIYDQKSIEIIKHFREIGISAEFMSTVIIFFILSFIYCVKKPNAIATFNILIEEDRNVGAALLTIENNGWE